LGDIGSRIPDLLWCLWAL